MDYSARWTFEGNTNDVSGNNHHQNGGLGTVAYSTDSAEGEYSLDLDGTTYIRYSVDGNFMEISFSQWMFSAWIKPDALLGIQNIIDEGGGTNGLAVRLNGSTLEAAVRNGGAGSQTNAGTLDFPADGEWHHLMCVFDNGKFTLYLDGIPGVTSEAGFSTVNSHSGNGGIGWTDGGSGFGSSSVSYFSGLMDDVRYYYEMAYTVDQIADLGRNDGDRNNLNAGTYEVTVSSSTGCTKTESITIIGGSNFITGGIIQSDEDGCGSFDPAPITSLTIPSGGGIGITEFQWEYKTDGMWMVIPGVNADNYDPFTITTTTQYRRGARKSPCTDWVYSNVVTKTIVTNTSNGGTIDGDEIVCGSYDPNLISSTEVPNGGSGGILEYQWQKNDNGLWEDIVGAISETYDPGVISLTTQYKRGARLSPCTPYVYSNVTVKKVISNFDDPGIISGNEENCNSYDPEKIVSIITPSGGSEGTLEYQWESSIDGGGSWTDIVGGKSESFDPVFIAQTTHFRRKTRRDPCLAWINSNTVIKTVVINITNAGIISGNESICGSYNPSIILSSEVANGGVDGVIQYQWEISMDNINWSEISGSTSEFYDPPFIIMETTYYRRKARRLPCLTWINSMIVTKEVNTQPIAMISDYPTTIGSFCENLTYTFESADIGGDITYMWSFGGYGNPSSVTGKGPHNIIFDVPDNEISNNITVSLSVSNGFCSDYDEIIMEVRPDILITEVSHTDPSSCSAMDGTIDIMATYPSGSEIIVSLDGGTIWNPPGVLSFNSLSAGTYDIRVKYDNGDCEILYGDVTLTEPNGPSATMTLSSTEICGNQSVVIQASPVSGSPTFSWDFGADATPATATGTGPHSVVYGDDGLKSVVLTLTEGTCNTDVTDYVEVIENYDDGGSIVGATALCGTNDPQIITSSGDPSGGNGGTPRYQWQESTDIGNTWADIAGATANSYDPSSIFQIMVYRRKARRSACGSWQFSNEVKITPTSAPTATDDYYDSACPGIVYVDNVSGNDINLINTTYTVTIPPSNGAVDIDHDGEFFYTPATTFCGTDEFTYEVCNEGSTCCSTATVIIDLSDATAPSLANIPGDITVHCDEELPNNYLVNAVENCQSVTLGLVETSTQGADTCSVYQYTLTRKWTAVDYCGNNISNEQNIHVRDVTIPDIHRVYKLVNGKKLVAGVMENTTHLWKTISFPIRFDEVPIVLAQVVTENEMSTVIARVRNISTTQFQVQLQEQESGDNIHAEEDVSWIAIEPGSQTSLMPFDVGSVLASSTVKDIDFNQTFSQTPAFLSMLQSNNEKNPATVRYNTLTTSGVNIFIEEELSLDPENTHGFETVGYVSFENTGNIIDNQAEVFGEVGTIVASSTVQTITLNNTYHNPVVVFGGVSQNEMTPVTISVNNLNQSSFDVRIKEWDYEDDNHTNETISYIVIEGSIPFNAYANCDAIPEPPQLYAEIRGVDNCDQSIAVTYTQTLPDFDCISDTVVYRTWYVEDECGNSNSYTQEIILRDTTPPTFTVPADVTVVCGGATEVTETGDVVDEDDNCSYGLDAVYTDNLGNLNGCLGYYERIWTLTDFCGNSTVKTQVIHITDPDDTDGDGTPNSFDHDDDNDGIPDVDELFTDLDGDGITNELDLDSDNDGVPDIIEAGFTDVNGDGVVDNVNVLGWDDDGDGFADGYDADDMDTSLVASDNFDPTDFEKDRDSDGVMNVWDLDSDNDGIPDLIEAGGVDTDGNGIIDYPIPGNPTSMEDGDGDGFVDVYDADDDGLEFSEDVINPLILFGGGKYYSGTPSQNPDADYDGVPDLWDLDSDNDTAPDLIESGGVDENGDGRINSGEFLDTDSNGFHDVYSDFPLITTDGDGTVEDGRPEDTNFDGSLYNGANPDSDGLLNHRDLDSDNDGIYDILECGNLTQDANRDGHLDTVIDANQDGFDDIITASPKIKTDSDGDTVDGRPEDDMDANNSPYESLVLDGTFGDANGEPDIDEDGDGVLNLADTDSDGDLILDENEDKNGNGTLDPGERDYLDRDTDDDLIIDGIEDANQDGDFDQGETDPLNPDTDYDLLQDGIEDANQDGDVDLTESDPRDPCDPNPTSYCLGIVLDLRVKLQGAMIQNDGGGLMRDDLRKRNIIPTTEPYSDYEYLHHVGEGGGEEIDANLFDITGGDAVVDWVLIELRSATRADSLVATRAAILQRDGDIVEIDGVSDITFYNMPSDNYYVGLRHRNHLGIITSNPHFLSPNPTEIDFTNTATNVYGDAPLVEVNGEKYMWAGDLNQDRQSVYQGPSNDVFDMFLKIMLDSLNDDLLVNFVTLGYYSQDLNLDGKVIYQGPDNDRSKMLFNVTLKTPENPNNFANFVVREDLPEYDNGTDNNPCFTGATDPGCDFDNDGLINSLDPDDDNDGVFDLNDIDPFDPESDSDEDGLSDNHETQGDGVYNVGIDTNPLNMDTDNDSITDDKEDKNGNNFVDVGETDPLDNDTDDDGIEDGAEDTNRNGQLDLGESDPLDLCDPSPSFPTCDYDGDGFPNNMDLDDDNDGVKDDDDVDSFDESTDSDGDGINDFDEIGGDGVYNPLDDSDPLDACDPNSENGNCIGVDLDGDGYFTNYSADDDLYDSDDADPCIPDVSAGLCDFDNDTIVNNTDSDDDNDGVADTNDVDPYDKNSDSDFDGLTDDNETGNDGSYDPITNADSNPLEACDPDPNNGSCIGIDGDSDGHFANYPSGHIAYDIDDTDQCIPDPTNCGLTICEDIDGDGYVLVCHNGITQSISHSEWVSHETHGDYCGPCQDYITVAPGYWTSASTWQNGNIPPYNVNGESVIINHSVTVQNDITIQGGGNLWVEDATFAIQNAKLTLNDGSVTFINAAVDITYNFDVLDPAGQVTVEGGSLNISQSFLNHGDGFFKNVYLTLENDYRNDGGADIFENTCVKITNGDFKNANSGNGDVTFRDAKIEIVNGSLVNEGGCTTSGNLSAAWIKNGWIWDTGDWGSDIDHYCVNGLTLFGTWNNLPPIEECGDISNHFANCADGGADTDDDGDGYFANYPVNDPLYDPNDMNSCIPDVDNGGCIPQDNDLDTYYGNYPKTHPQYDSDDDNNCVPDNNNCANGLCEDIDGDGFITICHSGTTQNVAVSEWSTHLGHGDVCGPCADYRTIANGLWTSPSTWENGNVPLDSMNNLSVVINHDVISQTDIELLNGSHLWIENGTLTVNGVGQLLMIRDASVTSINSVIEVKNDLKMDDPNARLTVSGGSIIAGNKYENKQGRSHFENVSFDLHDKFEIKEGAIDYLVDVCVKVGYRPESKFKGGHGSEMHLTNVKVHMPQGNFDNHCDLYGTLTAVWLETGDLKTHNEIDHPSDIWQANVLQYCVGGSITVSNTYLSGAEDCAGITDVIGDCSAGGDENVDNDNDGYFSNFAPTHLLFDIDDSDACIPSPSIGSCDFDNDAQVNSVDADDDNDGVLDVDDVDDYDINSDSDMDGIVDDSETGSDGTYDVGTDSNPLSACDPDPNNGNCIGIDNDSDGYFANYPVGHAAFDSDDSNGCIPDAAGCSGADYITIASGNWSSASTWQGGNIPPQIVDGESVKITYDVTVLVGAVEFINSASLDINGATLTTNDGHLKFKYSSSLISLNANYVLTDGNFEFDYGATGDIDNMTGNIRELKVKRSVVTVDNANITMSKFLEVKYADGSLTMKDCVLDIAEEVKQSEGFFRLENVCMTVGEYFQTQNGTTELENVCAEVGTITNGYFRNFLNNNITLNDVDVRLKLGSFTNDSSATINGTDAVLWVENGGLTNHINGNWTASISDYCVSGSVTVPGAYLPASEDCANIATQFDVCSCEGTGGAGSCADLDGDGTIVICHGGTTTQTIPVSEWSTHEGHGDVCGPCANYRTIADGSWDLASTWDGGNIPPLTIAGESIIINHTVTQNSTVTLGADAYLWVEDGNLEFTAGNANLEIEEGEAVFTNSILKTSNSVKLNNVLSKLTMIGSSLDIGYTYLNLNGSAHFENTCISVEKEYDLQNASETMINVCLEAGLFNNTDFTIDSQSDLTITNSKLKVGWGDFINNGTVSGNLTALWVQTGNLTNNNTWTADVNKYCVSGNIVDIPLLYLPNSEDCAGISVDFSCSCP
jgi:hypothetical protein